MTHRLGAAADHRGGNPRLRTPGALYWLISQPLLRAVLGGDIARRDVQWIVPAGLPCLEVGSGGGFYTMELLRRLGPHSPLLALDPAPASLGPLRARAGSRIGLPLGAVAGSGLDLPVAGGSLGAVFFGYSLEEMPDPVRAIVEAARVLRPHGQLVIFLWRPVLSRARRRLITDALEDWFVPTRSHEGVQNLRLAYRRRAAC